MKKEINLWTKKELLALPMRDWSKEGIYDSLLIFSTGRKHDSGWDTMAIIGVTERQPKEICTICSDDIEWKLPAPQLYGVGNKFSLGQFRSDCCIKSGALHVWTDKGMFHVGTALSSITIELVSSP